MHTWVQSVPLFPLALGIGLVLSAVLAAPMATTVRLPWFVVFGPGASLSLVVAATVTPSPAWGPA